MKRVHVDQKEPKDKRCQLTPNLKRLRSQDKGKRSGGKELLTLRSLRFKVNNKNTSMMSVKLVLTSLLLNLNTFNTSFTTLTLCLSIISNIFGLNKLQVKYVCNFIKFDKSNYSSMQSKSSGIPNCLSKVLPSILNFF